MTSAITCAEGTARLVDYLEQATTDAEAAAIGMHVGGCERCQAFVASYRETSRIMRSATEFPFPGDLQDTLRAFLRRTIEE
jgi:hypothetical protein